MFAARRLVGTYRLACQRARLRGHALSYLDSCRRVACLSNTKPSERSSQPRACAGCYLGFLTDAFERLRFGNLLGEKRWVLKNAQEMLPLNARMFDDAVVAKQLRLAAANRTSELGFEQFMHRTYP